MKNVLNGDSFLCPASLCHSVTSVGIGGGGSVFARVGAMELAHSKYKMDGERGTNGMSRQREGREEAVCLSRAALFL